MTDNAPIKVLVTILGLDQHEVGALAIAATLRDAGMEVVYGGRFNLPPAVVNTALQEDVDIIGISTHSWEYLHFLEDIFNGLKEAGMDVPVVVGGSVVTDSDKTDIISKGVAAAFGPTDTPEGIVAEIRRIAALRSVQETA
jgi:methylmalonyl-CoA mutase C-terminal domain/subunit